MFVRNAGARWRVVRGGLGAEFARCPHCYALCLPADRYPHLEVCYGLDKAEDVCGEVEVELAPPGFWRQAWEAACDVFRRPQAAAGPPGRPLPPDPQREERWAAMAPLIARTTSQEQ